MSLKDTYNKIAEEWVKDHNSDTWWQEGTDAFLSFLPKGARVLDVGCGGGIKTKYIADKGYVPSGIDFSEKMIEIAKRELPGIDFDVADIYDLSQYPKKFDGVFAQAVLLHIPKTRVMDVLKQLRRKLNEGGFLYIGVKSVKEDGVEEKNITEDDVGYKYERFFSFFIKDELKSYIKKLGMELVWEGTTTSGRADWIQVVGKK